MSHSDRPPVPPYFDYLIAAFRRGEGSRSVHLGHWDEAPPAGEPLDEAAFAVAQQRLDEVVIALADIADGQRVLDVGCGFGGTLARLDAGYSGMSLVGINVDPRQLDICRGISARGDNALHWQLADACALPFGDATFDRVLCIEAMFHFRSRRRFFAEAGRVLRPGGVLAASDIVLTRPRGVAPAFSLGEALQAGFGPWPDPWGDDADHRELARAAGLHCDTIVDGSVNTLASHRFTAPADPDVQVDPGDPARRAAVALAWLHRQGLLHYIYLHAARTPPA